MNGSMNNESMMEYLLIGLLLVFGFFCLYRMLSKRTEKKQVRQVATVVLFVVYVVISAVMIVVFNQLGSARMTLLMLLILMSMVGFCILFYGFLKNSHEIKKLPTLLFVLYIGAIAYATIFSREEGSKTDILLEFESITQAIKEQSFDPLEHLLMNIVLFIPVGFLFVAIYPEKLNKISLVIPLGLMLTVLIETVQMILQMGQCDLEDLVANALGAVVGLIAYRLYKRIHL